MDNNNPIRINDEGIKRLVQHNAIIGSDGGRARVTNGGLDVNIQDQHTDPVIIYFNQVKNSTTLAVLAVKDSYDIVVVNATGIAIGSYIILFNATFKRFTSFFVVAVNGTTITLDSPMDVAYPVETFVDISIVDLNVNGSTTPQRFGLRGTTVAPESVPIEFDLTRLIFVCEADSAVRFGLFGNLPALTKGLLFRKRDGRNVNIWNVKTNDQIAGIMYDFDVFTATNPSQGQDGFKSRLTFAGQNKIGVTVRLAAGEDAELWVQDDLTELTSFRIIAEGHIVE